MIVDRGSDSDGGGAPDGTVALAAGAVDGPHPVHRLADAAARPVEGRRAHVPGLLLPLAVCAHVRRRAWINQNRHSATAAARTKIYIRWSMRKASSYSYLAAWRSRGCGRRRARPLARGATRRATRPRSRTGAGSACASFSPCKASVSMRANGTMRCRLPMLTYEQDGDAYWLMEM